MDRRRFLQLGGAGAATLMVPGALASTARRRPNIILLVSDDQGYGDVGSYGCKDIPTPHIDGIGAGGVRFTDAYVTCPLCSPSRAGMLTGRYQQRFGHEFNTGKPKRMLRDRIGLAATELTLGDTLGDAGYATGVVGKWHLGMNPEHHPRRRGFDEFFGFLAGGHPYFERAKVGNNPIFRGTQQVREPRYLTTALGQEGAAFVRRWKKKPFFLYLPFNAPHKPMEAPQAYLDRFQGISDPRRRTYAAMVSAMDDAIGAVLKAVRDTGQEQDTLVIFLSDNGGATEANASSNGPLRAHKGALYEGGVRVPFMASWKGRLPANKVVRQPVSALDIYPTVLAAAGARGPGATVLDGINLLPHLGIDGATPKPLPDRPLFWRLGQRSAMRHGKWKLVQRRDRPVELYDLTTDLGESNDLAGQKPAVVNRLQATMASWQGMMGSPRWKPEGGGKRNKAGGMRKGGGLRRRRMRKGGARGRKQL